MRAIFILIAMVLLGSCGGGGVEANNTASSEPMDIGTDMGAAPPEDVAGADRPVRRPNTKAALPAPSEDPNELIHCPRMLQEMKRSECAYYDRVWSNLRQGSGGIVHPERMTRGETATIRFGVTADPKELATSDVLGEDPNQSVALKVGSSMEAQLTGEGFEIKPPGLQKQGLDLTSGAVWEWQVTALKAPRHKLMIQIYVRVRGPDGERSRLLRSARIPIEVVVTRGQSAADLIDSSQAWLVRGTNWLKALAAFLGALLAAWLALKKFRPQKPKA